MPIINLFPFPENKTELVSFHKNGIIPYIFCINTIKFESAEDKPVYISSLIRLH